MLCFDAFRGFLHKIYAATTYGKGGEGTYIFFSRRLGGQPGAGHRAQGMAGPLPFRWRRPCAISLIRRGGLGRLGCLAFARWAGWSGVQVSRHVKCGDGSNDLCSVNGEGYSEARKGSEGQRHKRRGQKEEVEQWVWIRGP